MLKDDSKNYYADFYVSTKGNDKWSGKLAEPNGDRTDGPFLTILKARDVVRTFKKDIYRNIYVVIRGGEYCLNEKIIFDETDSHYDSYMIFYAAYPGETPVFNSDVSITGWQMDMDIEGLPLKARNNVYSALLPKLPNSKKIFYTLYDNKNMLRRAHSKGFEPLDIHKSTDGWDDDFKTMESADRSTLYFPEGALRDWENTGDVEIAIQPNVGYTSNLLPLKSVDENNNKAVTAIPATYSMGKVDRHNFAFEEGSVRVENAIDYLDVPGEWVVDTVKNKVFYWPENGKPYKVVFPALTEYFLVEANNIGFSGLTFTRADRESITKHDIGLQHDWDMWDKGNAMLRFRNSENCLVNECRFTNSGSAGVRLDLKCCNNIIKNNLIDYIGGTGILIAGYGPGYPKSNNYNRIVNNHIHHCGELFIQSCGIMVWQSSNNHIKNNLLHNLPYIAIVLSGVRPSTFNIRKPIREMVGTINHEAISNEAHFQDDSSWDGKQRQWLKIAPYFHTSNNLVEDNEIFRVMEKMFDGNAIYLSDVGSGNILRRNYIHHLIGLGMQQAIRTDAFIKDTLITENIIYNCNGGGINVKYFENHVINNIIADIKDIIYINSSNEIKKMFIGYISLTEAYKKTDMPPNCSLKIQNNIIYNTGVGQPFYRERKVDGKMRQVNLEECDIDSNLYCEINTDDLGKAQFNHYQARGVDDNSLIGNPLFKNIMDGDFRLADESPAYNIGIKDIDIASIGLTREFPKRFVEKVINQLGADYGNFKFLEACSNKKEELKKALLEQIDG